MINMIHGDCIEAMAKMPNRAYELAIVDPVYGDLVVKGGYMQNKSGHLAKNRDYNNSIWNQKRTGNEYFKELFRVSVNQIIWGGNYFVTGILQDSSAWIVWDKVNYGSHYADCEIAWTSFKTAIRKFTFQWNGMLQGNMKNKEIRNHPTQKPVALYKWLLQNYAKKGDRILDTHGGSGSICIACHDLGYDLDWYELDADYYASAVKRYEKHKAQLNLFTPDMKPTITQENLI